MSRMRCDGGRRIHVRRVRTMYTKCKFDAISLVRTYNSGGASYEELKPLVVKNIIKRQGRILVKNVKNVFAREE